MGDHLSFSTINNYVSALNSLGKFADSDFDLCKDYGVLLLFRGFKRIKGDTTCPKDPLLPADLRKISGCVNHADPMQSLIWLIVLLAFRTLLRKSHFVATSDDDHEHLLRKRDISFFSWGCKITVNSSKTIQFHERSFEIPIHYAKHPLCAATLLKNFLVSASESDSDYLFTAYRHGKRSPVLYSVALNWLKTWSSMAELNKNIGFHSLRRGAASHMHYLKIPLVSIQ